MELDLKYKVIIVVVALGGAYAAGRWASPTKVITEIKTVEVEKKTDKTVADSKHENHKKIVIVKTEKPDGEKTTTTTMTDDTKVDSSTTNVQIDTANKQTDNKHEEDHPEPKTTVAAMAGVSTKDASIQYGAQIYRPVFGPFGIGLFGLGSVNSGITAGASVGLTF